MSFSRIRPWRSTVVDEIGMLPVAHILLKKGFSGDSYQLLKAIHEHCEKMLPASAVPCAYKFRVSFAVKPSGQRDTEALTQERTDYLSIAGDEIRSINF